MTGTNEKVKQAINRTASNSTLVVDPISLTLQVKQKTKKQGYTAWFHLCYIFLIVTCTIATEIMFPREPSNTFMQQMTL